MSAAFPLSALSLTHLNLDIRNLDVSERFYRDALGLPVERRDTSQKVCTADYLLVLNIGESAMGGTFHFGFRAPTREDVDMWAKRLRGAAVPMLVEPHEAGGVRDRDLRGTEMSRFPWMIERCR